MSATVSPKAPSAPDVIVSRAGGNLFMFAVVTDTAQEWVDEHVALESWAWLGNSFAVDQRYARDLADGMTDAGLTVE